MRPRLIKLLDDVRDAAAFVAETTHSRTLDDYRQDRQMRQAIERNLEIIGEAINAIAKLAPEAAERIDEFRRIIALRNALIHGYDLIEDDRVWGIVHAQLPLLHQQVEQLLQEETRQP